MARRSATCDTPGQPPRWVLNVMVGYATFWNELAALTGDTGPGHCPCCGGHPGQTDADERRDTDPHDLDDEPHGLDDDLADEDGDDRDGGDRQDLELDDRDDGLAVEGEPKPAAGPAAPLDGPGAPAAPRPLPDWWKAIDLRPGAGLADTRFYDTMCELEDCTPVTARTAISLGLAGTIRRVVFGPDSHIIDFSNDVDYFHGPLREAIVIRDRFCRDEGCGLPGRDSQIDHVIPRSKGGLTAESNGECKCGTANRLKGDRMP